VTGGYPFLLVVVDGPSEARDAQAGAEAGGVVRTILARIFGEDAARSLAVRYWRHIPRSPLRGSGGHAEKARRMTVLADQTTAYGAVLLLDNDHTGDRRLEELRRGVQDSGLGHRAAVGVAREMIEAWLLADPALLARTLPSGKRCEDLWGSKEDTSSNYPKHVLRRCVLDPRGWSHQDAIGAWSVERSRPNAPSLDAFVTEVERLAAEQGVR
jgi:hypothetical protein